LFNSFKVNTIQQTHALLQITMAKVIEASIVSLACCLIPRTICVMWKEKGLQKYS